MNLRKLRDAATELLEVYPQLADKEVGIAGEVAVVTNFVHTDEDVHLAVDYRAPENRRTLLVADDEPLPSPDEALRLGWWV